MRRHPGNPLLRCVRVALVAWLASIVFLVVGLVAGFYLLFRTDFGHGRLEAWISGRVKGVAVIRGLSGRLPFEGCLRELVLVDAGGAWMEARDVEWKIDPWLLAIRALHFDQLAANRFILIRRPLSRDGGDEDNAGSEWLGGWEIRIEDAEIREGMVSARAMGERIDFSTKGRGAYSAGRWDLEAEGLAVWRGEEISLRAFARGGRGRVVLDRVHATATGLSLELWGEWGTERGLDADIAISGSPLVATLADELAGAEGRISGRIFRKESWMVEAEVEGEGIQVGSLSNSIIRATVRGDMITGFVARIHHASAEFLGAELTITGRTILGFSQGGWTWDVQGASWQGLQAESSGTWTRDGIEAEFSASAPDIGSTPLSAWFVQGACRANGRWTGSVSSPVVRLDVQADGIQLRSFGEFQPKPASARVNASMSGVVALATAEWHGWTERPITLAMEVPMRRTAGGLFEPDPENPLSGRLQMAMRLEEIGRFADLRGTELAGLVTADLRVSGGWPRPAIAGSATLRGGRISFADSGTELKDIEIDLEGNRDGLEIRRFVAVDGTGGRLSMEGSILLSGADGFPIDAEASISRILVWKNHGSLVRVDGRLFAKGSALSPVVTGLLRIAEADIRLKPSPPPLARLPIVEDGPSAERSTMPSGLLSSIRLDLALQGEGIRVQGRGLDSTWRADLTLGGTADAPQIRGAATVERGFFLFMGRRFSLERAVISLDGRHPPDPFLDVAAVSRAGDMFARLYAVGPVESPELNLESDPPYPVEEILSRLLFARSTDAISPLQAVRLAHGLNVLRGRGGTLDVLERGQSALRVDQLELVQSESSDAISAISVGKYVGRHIYVGGEKSFNGAADLITVEVELTPSLILTTESSPRMRESIGLKWRRDY